MMSGEDAVTWFFGTVVALVVLYVLWPVLRETRFVRSIWIWWWKRR